MKKSLEDLRRRYGGKSDNSELGSASSTSSSGLASDQVLKGDEPSMKLDIAPKMEALSCREFVKHQRLPPDADFSKIDFSSSVIAGDLGQLYTNETVFNVFSASQYSLQPNGPPLELTVDENIFQQPDLDFSKLDFSPSSAANNFSALYTNESLNMLFPESLYRSGDEEALTAAGSDLKNRTPPTSNGESLSVPSPVSPAEAISDVPITGSMNHAATDQGTLTDGRPGVMKRSSLSPNGAPKGLSPFYDMIQQVQTIFSRTDSSSDCTANNLHTLFSNESTSNTLQGSLNCLENGHSPLSSCPVSKQQTSVALPEDHNSPVQVREPVPIESDTNDSSCSDISEISETHKAAQFRPHSHSDGDIPSWFGSKNSNSQTTTGKNELRDEKLHELITSEFNQFFYPHLADRTQSNTVEKRAKDTKNSEDGKKSTIVSLGEGQEALNGIPDSTSGMMVHPLESDVSQGPIGSPPVDCPVQNHIPGGSASNPAIGSSAGMNPPIESSSDEAIHENHFKYMLATDSTLSDSVESLDSTYHDCRENVSECPNSLSAGDKAFPVNESTTVSNCVDEPEIGSLPKTKNYLEHDWQFQKKETPSRLVLGTSGCCYEGEICNNKMHGRGQLYFGKDQYIQASWEMNTLIEPQASILTMRPNQSKRLELGSQFTIFKSGCFYLVSIYDGYRFVAIVNPIGFKELDLNQSSDDLKASFLGRFKIVEIIHDDWRSKRESSLEEFVAALQVLTSKEADVVRNATALFFLSKFTSKNYSTRNVLKCILENDVFPSTLRAAAAQLVSFEDSYPHRLRNICMLDCPQEMKPLLLDLQETMSNLYAHQITEHRRSLTSKCPSDFPRLIEMITTLPDDKVLYITREDIGVFCHLLSLPCARQDETFEYTQSLFTHFLGGFERKLLHSNKEIWPSDLIPLIQPVFGYLFKSFSEMADEIIRNADRLHFQDMLLIDSGDVWRLKSEIPWTIKHKISPVSTMYCQSLKIQYSAVAEILHSFSPVNYVKGKRIMVNISHILSEPVKLDHLSNERLAWLLILAKSIPSSNPQAVEAVQVYKPLLQCYISFLEKSAADDHELFRVVTHSVIRFLFTTINFTQQYNESPAQHDTVILEDMMSSVIPRISRELEGSTYFKDLIAELNRYWALRHAVNVKTCHLPTAWRLMDSFVAFVVKPTVGLEVPAINLVRYLRSLNDFIDDIKDIDLESCWFIKSDAYDGTVMEKVNNKLSSENCSYRVTNVDGFMKLMKGKTVPKHYILEIVKEMFTYIMFHLTSYWHQKETLTNLMPSEKGAKAVEMAESTGMLLDAMRRSFFYLEEQPGYSDFETFKKAILEPFDGLIFKSRDFNDFKTRINMFMKESFWHTRNVNEIGIDQAIAWFSNWNNCQISDNLSDAYGLYIMHYNSNIETYCRRLRDKSSHLECLEAVKWSMTMPGRVHFSNWTEDFKTKEIPKLLAGLSAVWSILMSGGLSNSEKLLKPHCIQILCILRLLSVDKPKGAESHLAQVSTGQGKSLILGLLSSVLALTGHKARVVCYSKYLSTRDGNYFKEFFQHFGIADAISYGTFEDMANGFLNPLCNGKQTSLRRMVRDKVLYHADWASLGSVKVESNETILLIDEVDVFFNERFYGNCFDSLTGVKIPGLEHIQLEMWKLAKSGSNDAGRVKWLTDRYISERINMRNPLYRLWDAFCREPGTFHLLVDDANGKSQIQEYTNRSLINEHLMMMSKDAVLLARSDKMDHLFQLNDEGVVCMRNSAGQYLPTTVQSYLNTFAYFKLTGPVLPESSSPNVGRLFLKTGKISYARLPSHFPLIMGVSGTLKDLTEYEKKWIDLYIKEFSVLPSLFGESSLKFNAESNFRLVYKQVFWLRRIYHRVDEIVKSRRAVLVFFDSDERLNLFANEYRAKFNRANEMTSNTDSELRDRYIAEAGTSCTVTLTTRAMGRGLDYKSSVAVEKLGGIHVIQTFFSLDVKEEIQIRGRTARRDNKGSYELIICKEHLVHKGIILDDESEHTYSTMQPIRGKLMDTIGKRQADSANRSERDHEMTMAYYGMS